MHNMYRNNGLWRGILFSLLLTGIRLSGAEQNVVWQLGEADNSYRDFKIYYHPWEYGSVKPLINHPNMDHRTLTFTYDVKDNKRIASPDMPCGISTPNHVYNVGRNETCSNLKIRWREKIGGFRKLSFRTADWDNWVNGENGIRILLPNCNVFVSGLKNGRASKSGNQTFSVRFPVEKGENELEIRITTLAKHYRLKFDYIQLSVADEADVLPPVVDVTTDCFSAISHPGEKASLLIRIFNAQNSRIQYRIEDYFGEKVAEGNADAVDGMSVISLPTFQRGWYRVRLSYEKKKVECSYVVLEPVQKEYVENSRFGCHAFAGDFAARIVDRTELAELKMHRAFLAGAKWARWHCISWALREPQKGTYNWAFLREQLDIAAKYRIHPMLNVFMTPDWASSTQNDPVMLKIGYYKKNMVPPRDWNDWKRFLTALVKFCGPSVKLYELGNEPGYASAFWHIGSVEKYAEFLKYGYAGIKESNPDAIVLPGAPLTAQFMEEVNLKNDRKPYFDLLSVHYQMNHKRGSKVFAGFDTAMKRTLGHSVRTVNSEEMNWNYSNLMERAKTLVKLYVRDASMKIEKTFGFSMFENSGQSAGYWQFFNLKGFPDPQYASYRTMTHHLEHADYAGDLSGAEYEAYLFDRRGTAILVLWSDRKNRVRLKLGTGSVERFDLMDRQSRMNSDHGTYNITLNDAPIFLIGGNLSFLKSMVAVRNALPHTIICQKKAPTFKTFALPQGFRLNGMTLPKGWNSKLSTDSAAIIPDSNALNGVYSCSWRMSGNGYEFELPFLCELSKAGAGANLVRNGDFEQKLAYWWTSKNDNRSLATDSIDGSACLKIDGFLLFGQVAGFSVHPGDRYLLSCDLKGEDGSLGMVYSIFDAEKKKLFPKREGINALSVKGASGWKLHYEIVEVTEENAAEMKIFLLANHRKEERGKTIRVDNISIIRLTDKITPSKALYRGKYLWVSAPVKIDGSLQKWEKVPAMILKEESQVVKGKQSWKDPADLSAKMQVMMDSENLYFAVTVKDDVVMPSGENVESSWNTDSVQVGIDPLCEGREMHQLILARDKSGKLKIWKHRNFFTPEIPLNLTPRGELKDAEGIFRRTADGAFYEVRIPLTQLYPLNTDAKQIGFSWLVNDNDGSGRKYIQWSKGIGEKQFADLYGLLVRESGKKSK